MAAPSTTQGTHIYPQARVSSLEVALLPYLPLPKLCSLRPSSWTDLVPTLQPGFLHHLLLIVAETI